MSLLRPPLGVLSRQVPVSGRPVVQMGPGRELSCPLLLPGGVRTPVTAFLAQWSLPQSLWDPMPLPHFPVYPPPPRTRQLAAVPRVLTELPPPLCPRRSLPAASARLF